MFNVTGPQASLDPLLICAGVIMIYPIAGSIFKVRSWATHTGGLVSAVHVNT
jgi:hypothetical protein